MQPKALTPAESLEKTYLLQPPTREEIEGFKTHFTRLLGHINERESEENVKDHLMDFLKEVYYKDAHVVAPKGKTDFVIHLGKDATTQAGVLFEVKRPANKGEMITRQSLNAKAFHELLLYYFQERERSKNSDIRHCVVTNVYEWFIFDAALIDRLFYRNPYLAKEYKAWATGQKVSPKNELFYNEIARPFLTQLAADEATGELPFTYFDLRDYQAKVADKDKVNDKALLSLFKVLSPTHLLKLPAATDSNRLNPKFYAELLHLIGLEEIKDKGKKIIRRKEAGKRDEGSLLENTIIELDTANKLSHIQDRALYGATKDEQLFGLALELCITWINRILFLKLLESQLVKYNNGNRDYAFLKPDMIADFDELNKLFFRVLAIKPSERQASIQAKFGRIPYLNSSLFELTELEDRTISVNGLDNGLKLSLLPKSVLKDNPAYKHTGELNTLAYLFAFLEAYDFASESREELQEKNRTLINASVLGLIFEKINGYKDGSFYTPGFITEYMCRETVRKAVVQKFNDAKGWHCADFNDLTNKDFDLTEANTLINEIRLCDPAVGSGHFLVSALNELIAVKSDLRVLQDEKGKRLRGYTVSVVNDELVVLEEDEPFSYQLQPTTAKPTAERQRIQKTLFQEKQTIIENCLFGVDINPNSVKICRLRLWIELLKSAYYTDESGFAELETLPNIDINIKQGNSLISRFAIDTDLSTVLRNSKYSINQYRQFVNDYKNAPNKEQKRISEDLIKGIKQNFKTEIAKYTNPDITRLQKLSSEHYQKYESNQMFDIRLTKAQKEDSDKLQKEISRLKEKIQLIQDNKLYSGSFEWRFEFPEVLDSKGKFIGFDAVIGNPPYGVDLSKEHQLLFIEKYKLNTSETAILFIALGMVLTNNKGLQSYIVPKSLTFASNYKTIRDKIKNDLMQVVDCEKPWPDVKIEACIFQISKEVKDDSYDSFLLKNQSFIKQASVPKKLIDQFGFFPNGINQEELALGVKLNGKTTFGDISSNKRGASLQKFASSSGSITLLGGIDIKRNGLKESEKFINSIEESNAFIKPNSVLVQNIVAHVLYPQDHIKIIACLPPDNQNSYGLLDTINQITFRQDVSNVFGWCLLNSSIINWYVYRFIYAKAVRTMHFDNAITDRIPFPEAYFECKEEVDALVNSYVNADDNARESEADKVESMIFDLYRLKEAERVLLKSSLL